jgi:hypothetical protein
MSAIVRTDRLLSMIKLQATEAEMTEWWNEFELVESDITAARRPNKDDAANVRRLSSALSEFIAAIRDGHPSPDRSPVSRALRSLRASVAKGTIGEDGWPMK